jgi:hypothetical protein
MRNKNLITAGVLLCLLALCLPAGVMAAGNPGDAGLLFLRQGMGTREAAMGGGGVAATEGASAAYWNPSRLVFDDPGTAVLLQQQSWLGAFDYTAAALSHHASFGVIGITFQGLFADEIQRYGSENVGIPEGTFSPYDLSIGLSYARGFGEEFAVGAQAKLVYEKIDIYSGEVVLFDLFATWQLSKLPGLSFAVTAMNLGGQMTINQEPFDPPRTVTVGAAWTVASGALADRLTLVGDMAFFNDGNDKAHVGGEFKLVPELALRLGYRVNYENQGLTAGAGVRYGVVGLGYAYEDITDDALDSGHRFSLEFYF